MDLSDTIVAVASATGGSLRGAVRLTGPRAVEIVAAMTAPMESADSPLRMGCAAVVSTEIQLRADTFPPRSLPVDLFIWPGRRSYTRQPTVEIHTLGSPPLLEMLVRQACRGGARLAAAGEFTLRAFLAGRIDLTQAEAVLGVIDAAGDQELHTALRQLAGGLADPLNDLREELLLLLADLEAGLDFADEDIEFIAPELLVQRLADATHVTRSLVGQLGQRTVFASRPRVVLAGPTNAGKSSLFNAIVARVQQDASTPAAIISPEPGATRDYLTASITTAGAEWELVDTAGEESEERLSLESKAAQTMTKTVRQQATLVLVCTEASRLSSASAAVGEHDCQVVTKVDEVDDVPSPLRVPAVWTSAATGEGLDELIELVVQRLTDTTSAGEAAAMVPSTAMRSHTSLCAALESLELARQLAVNRESEELVAAETRLALDQLGQVVGAVYTEDVLDRVFSRFCIGK